MLIQLITSPLDEKVLGGVWYRKFNFSVVPSVGTRLLTKVAGENATLIVAGILMNLDLETIEIVVNAVADFASDEKWQKHP